MVKQEQVKLAIDWRSCSIRPKPVCAAAIAGFQEESAFAAGDAIPIAPGRLWPSVLEDAH